MRGGLVVSAITRVVRNVGIVLVPLPPWGPIRDPTMVDMYMGTHECTILVCSIPYMCMSIWYTIYSISTYHVFGVYLLCVHVYLFMYAYTILLYVYMCMCI